MSVVNFVVSRVKTYTFKPMHFIDFGSPEIVVNLTHEKVQSKGSVSRSANPEGLCPVPSAVVS